MLFSKNGARMRKVGGIFFLRDRELRAVQEAELTGEREKIESRLETERRFPETVEVITEGKRVVLSFQYVEVKCPFCGEWYKRRAAKACMCGAVETELILRGSQFAIFSEELESRI